MCSPLLVMGGLSVVNTLASGRAAEKQGQTQGMLNDYQAQVEIESAMEMAKVIRRAGRKTEGAARAQYGASGVRVDEGSAVEVQQQIAMDVEQDAFAALLDGQRNALGLRLQGQNARRQGRSARQASYIDGLTTLGQAAYMDSRSDGWKTQRPAPIESVPINYIPGRR